MFPSSELKDCEFIPPFPNAPQKYQVNPEFIVNDMVFEVLCAPEYV